MNFNYARLVDDDIIQKVKPLLDNGSFHIRDDGRLDASTKRMVHDPPWVYAKHSPNRKCLLWHNVYFDFFGFIPSFCHNCFKIVVRPNNLKQLFQLYELERKMDYPSKCGIEKRKYVFGNYGGYFYTDSMMEGVQRHKEVNDAVHDNISGDIKVILKRGCTEFEMRFGKSDRWQITQQQEVLERKLDEVFVQDYPALLQPDHAKAHIFRKWIEYAYSIADPTYKEFNEWNPLYPDVVTYNDNKDTCNGPANC